MEKEYRNKQNIQEIKNMEIENINDVNSFSRKEYENTNKKTIQEMKNMEPYTKIAYKEKQEIREKGSLYIYPQLADKWNEFVAGFNDPFSIAITQRCLKMMETFEEDSSYDNIMAMATKTASEIDGYALTYARGIMFNFCKYGPEFCLALECAKAEAEAKIHNDKPSDITITHENATLLVHKMFENQSYQKDIDGPKRSI